MSFITMISNLKVLLANFANNLDPDLDRQNVGPDLDPNHLKTTVKPVLSGHSKIDKTKVLIAIGSLMKVESIAECSKRAFCNTYDLH